MSVLVTWVPVNLRARDRRGRSALDLARPASAVAAVLTSCGLGPHLNAPTVHEQNAARADAVEVALLDHISRAPGVERTEMVDGFVLRTGLKDNSRNGVVCSRLSSDIEVADVVSGFVGTPARWYVDDDTDPGDLRYRLEQAGCEAERTAVHMVAELAAVPFAAAQP